ncbi:MAG TPA: hypothetical protein VGK09_14685 [Rhodocyclaceae bacterium]|jgi:hypothetical protein
MKWIYIFWPSFVTAVFGEMAFFAFIDPQELYLFGEPVQWSSMAVYSTGFLMFWSLTALTAAFCYFFQHLPVEADPKEKQNAQPLAHFHP